MKKPPGEGTGPTKRTDPRGKLVGRVPPRGEPGVFEQAAKRPQRGRTSEDSNPITNPHEGWSVKVLERVLKMGFMRLPGA